MRAGNPAYLTNDFFTNASQDYGPRTFFADSVAFFARLAPLSTVYLLLTIIANIAIAAITALAARDLFKGSDLAGLLSAVAVMTLKTFWLGYSNIIYDYFLEPAHLAMPFVLVAIWAGLRRKPILMAIMVGIAALVHPLMGLETGAIMLGVMLVPAIWDAWRTHGAASNEQKSFWLRISTGIVIYVAVALFVLLPYIHTEQISDSQFIQIIAFYRHPHHYVPSTFGLWQYLQAIVFLIPAGIAWYFTCKGIAGFRNLIIPLCVLVLMVALLCLGGYLFVEVFPSRLWTTAQTFRLLFIIKWLGLIGIAGFIGYQIQERKPRDIFPYVLLISLISQLTLFLSFFVELLRNGFRRYSTKSYPYLAELIVIMLMVPLLKLFPSDTRIYILFPLFAVMAFLLLYSRRLWLPILLNSLLALMVVVILLDGQEFLPAKLMTWFDQPVITLNQLTGDDILVANYAKAHSPADAIFLTPPTMGEFRYTADRAIVVDFFAFPFQDSAMIQWEQRLFDCYGKPANAGFESEMELKNNYISITRADLLRLQATYGITYAVLYRQTVTDFPILYKNATYKIIQIK